MYNFVVQLFVLLILWEVLKLLIEKRKGEHKRNKKKSRNSETASFRVLALIFSPNAKKSPRFMEEYTLLAKEKNYAEEHCKGFC